MTNDRNPETKLFIEQFLPGKVWKLFFELCTFIFLCLFTNKARKLECAESNPINENIPISISLSVGQGFFLLFLVHVLSLSLSLTPSLSPFVGAALQLLLCGLMSSSIIFITAEL